ncbi:two-component regulator propeller domain-containing protein [Flavobacterium gelidilacus]|uniref:type IX secretion system anionic LPS delivery protein PorZ n=1 Tax=Flavobacterium gelidilacus TaxID=206041 RepID=UPI0004259236|nr:two-component regulator propeller domain-containing protein [Flavobacterium gelidilacus]
MRKTFLLLLFSIVSFSQTNQLWKGYYSYNEIIDISYGNTKVVAATENALFSKDIVSSELNIKNSIDGFKPETVTSVYYSQNYKLTLTGNDNGLIIITKDDGTIINKVDIINEVPVPPNMKTINHFFEFDNKVYISTNYGITVLKLNNLEFEDTYYIGSSGEDLPILQTTVYNGEIYAATTSQGIKKALVSNPNLIDFNQWQIFDNGIWKGITNFNNQLVALNSNQLVYKHNGTNFQQVFSLPQQGIKFTSTDENLIITCNNHVYVLDILFSTIAHVTQIPDNINLFTCAITIDDNLFIGTENNGLFQTQLSNPILFDLLSPDGPEQNYIFRVKKTSKYLWAVYGGYDRTYDPNLSQKGISKFSNNVGWEIIPYDDLLGVTTLSNITVNPINEDEIYVASHHDGLLKINNAGISVFNETNTGANGLQNQQITTPTYVSVRINGPAFDKSGNLWMTNAYVERPLKSLKSNGTWQSIDMSSVLVDAVAERYAPLVIDKNSTKWIPCFRANGLVAFNENFNNKFIVIKDEDGNIPNNDIRCLAIDNRNQLWIGTYRGLRTLSVDKFINENEIVANSIIIEEDGLAQELFYQQSVLDIAVDGANNKWVSIAGAGVFLVSPNGQQTIYRFTKTNSPLPSNNIIDLEIDDVTGEVFMATDKGLISFLGVNTKPSDDLSNVYVYPNPVRPEFNGTVKISGLIDKATIKITDIEGNLVHETTSEGGTIEWDTTAFGKYRVASGVYMIFISAEDGIETKVKKVMIIR